MPFKLIAPFVPVCLFVGPESLICDVEHYAVLSQIQRDDGLLTFARTVTKAIQGNGDQPFTKIQDADLVCRRAFEGIIGADESFLNDVFSIVSTCQAQGK